MVVISRIRAKAFICGRFLDGVVMADWNRGHCDARTTKAIMTFTEYRYPVRIDECQQNQTKQPLSDSVSLEKRLISEDVMVREYVCYWLQEF